LFFSQPLATALREVVIDSERIISPLVPVLQEATAENTFADLRVHLPDGLIQHEDDLLEIVRGIALPQTSATGEVVLSSGEVLFVSSGMTKAILNTLLPPLIETFAKEEAERIDLLEAAGDNDTGNASGTTTPGKKGSKKSKSKSAPAMKRSTASQKSLGVPPLLGVACAILEKYPDLADIQESYGPLPVGDNTLSWDIDDVENDGGSGPLVDMCRQILYTTSFQAACRLAVNAEVERLRSTKKASSVLSRKYGAAKVRSVESSFEDSFSELCQKLALYSKFLDFADASDAIDVDTDVLRGAFLRGNCADFASRITQFCLFKNELEGDVFSFGEDTAEATEGVPTYCQPVVKSSRRNTLPYLSCLEDDDGEHLHKPLPSLRKVLSGSLGVTLTRLWTHCGGDCYDGGAEIDTDGTVLYVKPGSVSEFMSFVEENCLTICGLPFSKLNKKSEKQFLFARRQELTNALGSTSDGESVLELTIMLLFQQIRGLTASGPHLTGSILKLLCHEKKIPEAISALLVKLAKQCVADALVDDDLVAKVKACGLSRDVTKHTVE
jgi:hypothetical protein